MNLKLELITEQNLIDITLWGNNKQLFDNIANFPYPYTLDDAKEYYNHCLQMLDTGKEYVYCLLKENDFVGLGTISFVNEQICEIGYWLAEPYRDKGLGSELVKELINKTLEFQKIIKIIARVLKSNTPSLKVLLKNNFETKKELIYPNWGNVEDTIKEYFQEEQIDKNKVGQKLIYLEYKPLEKKNVRL